MIVADRSLLDILKRARELHNLSDTSSDTSRNYSHILQKIRKREKPQKMGVFQRLIKCKK